MGRLGLPHAGAWLEAVPITALGLYLQPSEFVPATRYRLGCKVYESMTELDPALHASATVMHWETMQCVVATREKESPGTMPSGMQSTTPITRSNSAGCCSDCWSRSECQVQYKDGICSSRLPGRGDHHHPPGL